MQTGTPVPDRAEVLGRAIPFDRTRWLSVLPGGDWWPDELDDCPTVGGRPRVDRETVFGIARRADTPQGRRHLLTAALVWGTGTKAQSVARRARIFTSPRSQDIEAHLASALGLLRREGAEAAYSAFRETRRIKFLGPAFFTKVLYFAGHEQCDPVVAPRPLILDRYVALALRAEAPDEKWRLGGWTTQRYLRYLTFAHDQAQRVGVRPDQIEAALFARGGQLR
ncbi:hypothetical protein ACIQVT_05270 [Streptomyces sp. NPDC100445]|uniref:8-oxoguanine DNA glycosylase OGG fold protein n=1 Tax=Streptomyces sp. NPDC100445 TaxID=3366102 RepID=UPI00380F1B7F